MTPQQKEDQMLYEIMMRESGGRPNVITGGQTFDDFSKHPGVRVPIKNGDDYSTAAGLFQFTLPTWQEFSKKAGVNDFSKASQIAAARALLREELEKRSGMPYEQAIRELSIEQALPMLGKSRWVAVKNFKGPIGEYGMAGDYFSNPDSGDAAPAAAAPAAAAQALRGANMMTSDGGVPFSGASKMQQLLDAGYTPEMIQQMIAAGNIPTDMTQAMEDYRVNALRRDTEMPSGTEAGGIYIAASPLSHLAAGVDKYQGAKGAREARERLRGLREDQNAARTTGNMGELNAQPAMPAPPPMTPGAAPAPPMTPGAMPAAPEMSPVGPGGGMPGMTNPNPMQSPVMSQTAGPLAAALRQQRGY